MEVAAGPLSGPLDGLGAAWAYNDITALEVALAHREAAEEAGEDILAALAAPLSSVVLVAAVAGARVVLCAQLDGLNGLAEASCQVRSPLVEWYGIDSSP